MKAKITKANGTALDADTQVGLVNLLLHSLFSRVDVSLNERKMNLVNPLAAGDEASLGLKARYEFTKESHTVDMMGPIHEIYSFKTG